MYNCLCIQNRFYNNNMNNYDKQAENNISFQYNIYNTVT